MIELILYNEKVSALVLQKTGYQVDKERRMLSDIEIAESAELIDIREVAKKLGISRSYVSRIEKKALSKLKDRFEE